MTGPLAILSPEPLWPLTRGTTAEYVRAAAYENIYGTPIRRLTRIEAPVTEIVPRADIAEDSLAMAQAARSASEIARATGGRVTFVVVPVASLTAPVISLVVDPKRAAGAYAITRDYRIHGGSIVFSSIEAAGTPWVVTHEMGHMLGLGHTPDPGDVMYGYGRADTDRAVRFSPKEELVLRMMYLRSPGNAFPDNDADLRVSKTSAGTQVVFVCPH